MVSLVFLAQGHTVHLLCRGVKRCADYINDPNKVIRPFDENKEEIAYVEKALNYIKSEIKINHPITGKPLISGHNCNTDTAVLEFSLMEKVYHSYKSEHLSAGQKPNQAFHIILSYKGTDIAPDMVHQMGIEFARRLYSDEFQAVIATHLNTNNYHNHILVNAYALDGRHKFKDSFHIYHKFRDIANEISLEYGLPIFLKEEAKIKYRSWKEVISTKEGKSWKQEIRFQLNQAISLSSSYEEVLAFMEENGYEIQRNPRSITFKKGKLL